MHKSTMKNLGIKNYYRFEGWELISGIWKPFWRSGNFNIVPTEGLNEIQNKFWAGSAYTAAIYVGLIRTDNFGSVALTDTAAKIVTGVPGGSDNQWREFVGYSEATRQALVMGTAVSGAIDSSASPAVFTVTADFTLQGGLLSTASGKAAVTGKLVGATSATSTQAFLIGQQVRVIISSTLANA
jgi:hypothetical protein